ALGAQPGAGRLYPGHEVGKLRRAGLLPPRPGGGCMSEAELRAALADCGRSLFARGYSCGTSGNLSLRLADGGFLMSPTNVSLGALDPDALGRLDAAGRHIAGGAPTKEAWLQMAMYRARPAD